MVDKKEIDTTPIHIKILTWKELARLKIDLDYKTFDEVIHALLIKANLKGNENSIQTKKGKEKVRTKTKTQ